MLSGTYKSIAPSSSNGQILILRVDIDSDEPTRKPLHQVSGEVFLENAADGHTETWAQFQFGWRATDLSLKSENGYTAINAEVSVFPENIGNPGPVTIRLKDDTASVTFNSSVEFECEKLGTWLRDVVLHMQASKAHDEQREAILPPNYLTKYHLRETDPELELETSFAAAGVQLTVETESQTLPYRKFWSDAELHALLNERLTDSATSKFDPITWPLWGFLLSSGKADESDAPNPRLNGIMFNGKGTMAVGAEGPRTFQSRGFAVFRDSNALKEWRKSNTIDNYVKRSTRDLFFTWMHESGHALDVPHTFDPFPEVSTTPRQNAATWMAYPDWHIGPDGTESPTAFWNEFKFNFDDYELSHIRHGYWPHVATGGVEAEYSENNHGCRHCHHDHGSDLWRQTYGRPPLQLVARSQNFFEHMEPVTIEVRLRNHRTDKSVEVPHDTDNLARSVLVVIKKPNGNVTHFRPICERFVEQMNQELGFGNSKTGRRTPDRKSYLIDLTFGEHGFLFEEPGLYSIRVAHRSFDGTVVTSNLHKLRVGVPVSKERDRFAWDYFRDETGLVHALHGSRSDSLSNGWDLLKEAKDRFKTAQFAAKARVTLAQGLACKFVQIKGGQFVTREAEEEKALELLKSAGTLIAGRLEPRTYGLPLEYSNLMRLRTNQLLRCERKDEAVRCKSDAQKKLRGVKVKGPVLREMDAWIRD